MSCVDGSGPPGSHLSHCGENNASGSPPPAAIRAAPPSAWEVAARLKGWEGRGQAASWRWPSCSGQRPTQAHPRAGTPLLGRPSGHCKRHSQHAVPRALGAAGRVRKACCPLHPRSPALLGKFPNHHPQRWSKELDKGGNGCPYPGLTPTAPRPTCSSLQPHVWEAREWTPPSSRGALFPTRRSQIRAPDTGYNEGIDERAAHAMGGVAALNPKLD